MIRPRPVEAAAGHQQDIRGVQQVPGELPVVRNVELLYIQLGEQVEGGVIFDEGQAVYLLQFIHRIGVPPKLSLFIQFL